MLTDSEGTELEIGQDVTQTLTVVGVHPQLSGSNVTLEDSDGNRVVLPNTQLTVVA